MSRLSCPYHGQFFAGSAGQLSAYRSRIDNKCRVVEHRTPIERVMIRDDQYSIELTYRFGRRVDAGHPQVVAADLGRLGNVGVAVVDLCAELAELFNDLEAGLSRRSLTLGL